MSIVFVLGERWAERNEVSWHDHLCFGEKIWVELCKLQGQGGRQLDVEAEGLLGCGNNRCEIKQAGVQSNHCPWH